MPDVDDLAAILKKEPREIRNIMSMNNEYVSLEKDFNMDGVKDRLADVVEDKNSKTVEDILSDKELTEELKIAMEGLSDIEKEIINARYGLDQEKKTLKEIKKHKFKIVVSSLQTENTIYDINYYKKVIIIGNEANGVEQQIQEIADEKIKIPMIRKNRKLKCISSNRNYFV